MSSLLFGGVSPSGRLPITWYRSSYTAAVSPLDLNMRPDGATGHPGRTYRCGVVKLEGVGVVVVVVWAGVGELNSALFSYTAHTKAALLEQAYTEQCMAQHCWY